MPQEFWSNAIFSLVPTIALGLIFWFVIRAIIRSDRTERAAYAKIEAQERARFGLPPVEPGLPAAESVETGSPKSPTPGA